MICLTLQFLHDKNTMRGRKKKIHLLLFVIIAVCCVKHTNTVQCVGKMQGF
jgi:hypothetical protein